MKTYSILNDLHIGRKASGGVTPSSAFALRKHLLQGFESCLALADTDTILLGDVFDTFNIDVGDLLEAYDIACSWLQKTHCKLVCVIGNHDASADSTKTSSFDLFTGLLERRFPEQVVTVRGGCMFPEYDTYILSHVLDQETLDKELEEVEDCKYLLLHANYDNFFAVSSDHSLNVSEQQARTLSRRGITLVFAHEHQQRVELNGTVVVLGNQTVASVADALNNDTKTMMEISDAGMRRIITWRAEGSFCQPNWQELDTLPASAQFIRVTGNATAAQASEVVAAIARLRASSDAFVVTNAVQIAGLSDGDQLSSSLEQITSFSVLEALLEILTPDEGVVVKKLLEGNNV